MKKFVLVMVCALLMVVFIALNYLLWDRENKERNILDLEYSNASNNASINALGREIKNLEDENQALKAKLAAMDDSYKLLQAHNNQLEQEKLKIFEALAHKSEIIDKLKQEVDPKTLEAPIRKWVESIDAGDYESAYNLQTKKMTEDSGILGLTDFKNVYRSSVKSVKLKSIKLNTGGTTDAKKGDIVFDVTLEVKKVEDGNNGRIQFNDGLNERFFTIDYDKGKNSWLISNIFPAP